MTPNTGTTTRATDARYHVGLGYILTQHDDRFSFDRSASFADLWRIVLWNLIRHPVRSTVLSRRYMPGEWGP